MIINVITTIPKMFKTFYGTIKKALKLQKLFINIWDLKKYSNNNFHKLDDKPYGESNGIIIRYEPVKKAIIDIKNKFKVNKMIYLSPRGKIFNQKTANKIVKDYKCITFLCGRYSGIDQRIIDNFIDMQISISNIICSCGEYSAMIIIDTLSRLLPNIINKNNVQEDYFINNNYHYPQYTKPYIIDDMKVPKVLLSGNRKKIYKWKKQQINNNNKIYEK